VAAAQQVFGEKGYHAATVDDITRAASVAKGTFYLYFQEKREVYYEVVAGFFRLIMDIGESVAKEAVGGDFLARAELAAQEILQVFLANRELARLAHRDSMGRDPDLEKLVRGFYRELAEVEAANIRRGVELGLIREDADPMLTAYAHIGMAERLLLQLLDDPSDLPPPKVLVREMVRLAFVGLVRT
jgi:AcrR family transcriptional regulator